MPYMKTGWATVQTSRTQVEIWPEYDVIEHKHTFSCPCNPQIITELDEHGNVYWTTIHNSFDEFLDEDQTEPYTGL